jgi:hypothetical protein
VQSNSISVFPAGCFAGALAYIYDYSGCFGVRLAGPCVVAGGGCAVGGVVIPSALGVYGYYGCLDVNGDGVMDVSSPKEFVEVVGGDEDVDVDGTPDGDGDVDGPSDGDGDVDGTPDGDLDFEGTPDFEEEVCVPGGGCLNLSLNVGNDFKVPWEWNTSDQNYSRERVFFGWPLDLVLDKLDVVLRHGCSAPWCVGCSLVGGDCLIPFVFRSSDFVFENGSLCVPSGGNLTVDDINFSFWVVETIENVSYERRLRFSEGGNWTVSFDSGVGVGSESYLVPSGVSCGDLCFDLTYVAGSLPAGLDEYDAIDDSMYRLLFERLDRNHDSVVEKLDVDHDGVPDTFFDPNRMWFDAQDKLGIQTMWGPEVFKLVVWAG